jgi:hypothetical protein
VLRKAFFIENTYEIRVTQALVACKNVEMNQPATEACFAVLNAGEDFTDGVIALEGNWL